MNEVPVLIESIASLLTSYTTNSVGIRTSEYKYFRDKGSPTKNIHLYDLVKDSLEEELSDAGPIEPAAKSKKVQSQEYLQ